MKFTNEQALAITGFTGIAACNFGDFQADVEKRLGRPVFTHEFGDAQFVNEVVKPLYRDEFIGMCQ